MGFKFNPLTGKLDLVNDLPQGSLFSEIIPVTVSMPMQWTTVTTATITNIIDIEVFDSFNNEKLIVDSRIFSGMAQIRSNKIYTYSVHIEGY